jgi:hypothetical protein
LERFPAQQNRDRRTDNGQDKSHHAITKLPALMCYWQDYSLAGPRAKDTPKF